MRVPKSRSWILILLCTLLFLSATPAFAAQFITRNSVVVGNEVRDDLYIFGGEVSITEKVDGDLVVAGGTVSISAPVEGDLFIAGGDVRIDGDISRTARITGGTIRVNGKIGRDLMVGGGTVVLTRDSRIGIDLIVGAGNVDAAGAVGRDIIGGAGAIKIRGPIGRNVKISSDRVSLASNASIGGNLEYRSDNKVQIASGAQVSGRVRKLAPIRPTVTPQTRFFSWLIALLGMIVVGLLAAWLFPRTIEKTRDALSDSPWATLGLGFAVLFLTPVLVLIMMITIIGLPAALIVLLTYLIALYLAQIYAAAAIGALVLQRLSSRPRWIGAGTILGILSFALLRQIPLFGPWLTFFLIVSGLGAISLAGQRSWRKTDSA